MDTDLSHQTLDIGGLATTLVGEMQMVSVGTTEAQAAPTPERKRGGASTEERTLRAMKSPLLFAFNKFAAELREELRGLGTMSGAEVEKVIGDRWKGMNEPDKKIKIDEAREEQAKMLASCPLDASGNPILTEALLSRPGKKRKKGKHAVFGENKMKIYRDMTGVRLEAVVDGEFDAGFFFTARAKDSNGYGVLRGMFFKQHNKMSSMMAPPNSSDPEHQQQMQVLDGYVGKDEDEDEHEEAGDAGHPELTLNSGMVAGLEVVVA